MREMSCVGLPHFPEGILFKGFSVNHCGVAGRLEIIAPNETLDSTNAYSCRYKAFLYELLVDLSCVEPRERLFQAIDLLDGSVGKSTGRPFIRTFCRHEGINTAALLLGYPFFNGLVTYLFNVSIRECQRLFSDPLIISSP